MCDVNESVKSGGQAGILQFEFRSSSSSCFVKINERDGCVSGHDQNNGSHSY